MKVDSLEGLESLEGLDALESLEDLEGLDSLEGVGSSMKLTPPLMVLARVALSPSMNAL